MTLRQSSGQAARCPSCRAKLRVPKGFRRGRCPGCDALLGPPMRARNPSGPSASSGQRPSTRLSPQRVAFGDRTGRATAESRYRRFHEVAPKSARTLKLNDSTWWGLGHAYAVEYAPSARSARGNTVYRHLFGDTGGGVKASTAKIYASPDGNKLLIVGNFNMSADRGIVG